MQLSPNISLAQLQNSIDDALKMDVRPLLGDLHDRLTGAAPATPLTAQEVKAQELVTPVWVCHAFQRFLEWHGVTVAAAGITQPKDEKGAYEHISEARRAQLLRSVGGNIAYYEGELGKALKEINGTGRGGSKRSRIGLRVIRPR
ncbi:hypothetical protein [Pontibacter saemangeumensis]|uniref:hypothetical protein n=1 Tax=Pontibacter saemangeumensis TaxID=1084525 RepID=UPI0031E9A50F